MRGPDKPDAVHLGTARGKCEPQRPSDHRASAALAAGPKSGGARIGRAVQLPDHDFA